MSSRVADTGLRRNVLYGLAGWAAPSAVVLASYAVLIRHLGAARFGILVLAASTSGLLAFLDFGFAAALVKFVAEDNAAGDQRAVADIIVSSLLFYSLLGLGCALALQLFAPWMVTMLGVDAGLAAEAVAAFRLAGWQFPAFLLIAVLVSLFKGLQQFAPAALTLGALSVLAYGGAAAAVGLAGAGLREVMAISLAAHVVVLAAAAAAGYRLCRARAIPWQQARPTLAVFRRMFDFGWLMTVNAFSAILLYQIQRYLVAATLGPGAVAVYQTAAAGPAKVHQAIAAATEVLFPAVSAAPDPRLLRSIYLRMLAASGLAAGTVLIPLVWLAPRILRVWLGPEMAAQALPLLPAFAAAYFFIAFSPAPFHLLNGLGKPWVNTAFTALAAGLNLALLWIFWRRGLSLLQFAWSFAGASIAANLLFQARVERQIWRRGLLRGERRRSGGRAEDRLEWA